MSNPNREVFKYYGPYVAEYYNQFFNPNICHVCKSVDRGNLILCDKCCLISYCSEEHKMIHYPYHEKICLIIAQVLQVKPQQDTRRFNDWQQWIQSRKKLMKLIQEKLDDKMEPYMQQMILWSKSCYICHQQAKLQVCQRCFSANYCVEHANIFHVKHDGGKCDRLMLLLNINIETMAGNTTNISFKFLQFVDDKSYCEEMLEFFIEYILGRRKSNMDWLAKDYVLSDYLSGPLTIYSGLDRSYASNFLEESYFVIHIIAASSKERIDLRAWEILFHLVPELQKLFIVMVGSGLMCYYGEYNLCQRCTDKAKKLSYASIPMLYHDFVTSPEHYTVPNIILGLHTELNKGNISVASMREIFTQGFTVFLTASSAQEAKYDMIKIDEVIGSHVEPEFIDRNHFSGLVPHKDLKTGDTYFRNEYLIIYYCLYYENSEEPSTSSNI